MPEPNPVRIEYVPLGKLRRWPRNPKDHSLGDIHQSYDRFGYVAPMLLDERTGRLVAGHGRLDALQQRKATGKPAPERIATRDGQWLVPVVRGVSFASDEEAEAYGIADNRLVEAGGWNDAALAQVLADLAAGPGLEGIGFDGDDLDALLAGLAQLEPVADPGAQLSKADELQEKWQVSVGDVWQCGEHRICCGDCTDAAVVEAVMGGGRAGAVVTDPPYGISLDVGSSDLGRGDPQRVSQHNRNYSALIGDNCPYDPSHLFSVFGNCREMFLWGADYYAERIPNRVEGSWLVWDKREGIERMEFSSSAFEICWSRTKHRREIIRMRWAGVLGMETQDTQTRMHPTQKPVEVIAWILERYTKEGCIVVDPFLGSGTTLVSCERLGRRGRGIEIHAPYVAVCLERLSGMQLDCRKVARA